jgi:chemotaxis protein methyltransferase CheR
MTPPEVGDADVERLLEVVLETYQYDFREYARTSVRRRVQRALEAMRIASVADLMATVKAEPSRFTELLGFLTVQVTEMFRDPPFWSAIRTKVIPYLATYPSPRIWSAGVGTGEEAYSLAILLAEAGLLDRSIIYATDIEPESLRAATSGIYPLEKMRQYGENYVAAGGAGSLADHYAAAYGGAVLSPSLRKAVVFSDHSLSTDSVFAEVQLVVCRNVFIYFERPLQSRVLSLFADALSRGGFLGLGSKEVVLSSFIPQVFTEFDRDMRIYRRASG